VAPAAAAQAPGERSLATLSIEELANLEVTSVSKRPQPRLSAAGAVYVITREQILRSGATSIPEALRLAPGVEVARIDSHTWAISIRGFNSTTANKLLVLLDGRSLYTPLFSGVFWDVQDTLLEDVERIEVVAGPGGTLWGANAVNGVVNIITRHAADSHGTFLEAGGGDEERGFGAARYGARLGDRTHGRFYAKGFERDANELTSGRDATDDWRMAQGGFRLDWAEGTDTLTAQGDAYSGRQGDRGTGVGGANLLVRWDRRLNDRSRVQVQAYWDHTDRRIRGAFSEHRQTYDVELQHNLALGARHDVVWGLGYRLTSDDVRNTAFIAFVPARRTDQVFSAFLQDEIDLWRERLALTVGSKLEHNDYTGFEVQPSLRLALLVDDHQTVWAAASRAVRTPSRLDADLVLTTPLEIPTLPIPILLELRGADSFHSEELVAYEAGYRVQPSDAVSVELAAFYNRYDDLRSTEAETPAFVPTPSPHIVLPNRIGNGLHGRTRGATLAAKWAATPSLLLQPSYTHLDAKLRTRPGSVDQGTARETEGSSPRHQWALTSLWDLSSRTHVHAAWRRVDELPALGVEAYSELDLGLTWEATPRLDLSVFGTNLLDGRHREFAPAGSIELQRGVHCKATWRF
jgi:iron complex outermembrane receptor protein